MPRARPPEGPSPSPGQPTRVWSACFGLIGLGVSTYLVATHYFSAAIPLACASGGFVNCEQVTASAQSMVGPVPVAVLGLAWFVVFLGLLAVRARWPERQMALAVLGWSTAGLLVVFYLIYAELFLVGALCLWCTVVHAAVIAVFLLSVWDASTPVPSAAAPAGESASQTPCQATSTGLRSLHQRSSGDSLEEAL